MTRPIDMLCNLGGCFTNVSRALENNLAKICNARNHIYGENFKLKLCTYAQSMALSTRTKFQLGILIGGLPMCVLSYIFAWHRGSSGQPPWVRLLHSLGHCHLARLCKIYSAQRYETVNGLATNVPLHYPELNWSGCLYDFNIGIKNEWNKI